MGHRKRHRAANARLLSAPRQVDDSSVIDSPWRRFLFLGLALIGLAVAIELIRIHVMVHTDPGYRSFCAISAKVNCDTVAESRFAIFLRVPVAALATVVGVLIEVPVMLPAVFVCNRTRHWFPAGETVR